MLMQVIIEVVLDEIANELRHRRAFRSHILRTQFRLGLALEDRLLHLDTDGRYNAGTNVRILEILVVVFLDHTAYRLLESRQMGTSLRGVLSVHERIILLAILVAVGNDHLDVISLQMNDWIQRIGSHVLIQQIDQAIAGIELPTIV